MASARGAITRWLLILLALAACGPIVPATTPPQLEFTAGPPVTLAEGVYESPVFTSRYPAGWRIVTGSADQPPFVVYVAPDEAATIRLVVGALEDMTLGQDALSEVRSITLAGGIAITAIYNAPADSWDLYLPVFEAVVESVRAAS